jgi:predicted RNA binding protein YcfA (HicA-like mRNA interferase family)
MKAKEVIKLLEKDGWIFDRQSGSHKIFSHSTKKVLS